MTAVATRGCGCGTTAPAAGGDCGCGSGGGLTRPRFFAGQLLCEDDLTELTEYVTAKGRLHNRMFFEAGVVCGLDVVCDPCGKGGLTVHPGYALDCCGHDLVVSRPSTLDIGKLLREMRLRSGGVDCDTPGDEEPRSYGLYLRYAEQQIEPIAAYPTDDSCGGDCTPSRIRESCGFLLKAVEPHGHDDDPGVRLARCLGSAATLATIRDRAWRLERYRAVCREVVDAEGAAAKWLDSGIFFETLDALEKAGAIADEKEARARTEQVRLLSALVARSRTAGDPDSDVAGRLDDADAILVKQAGVLRARTPAKDWPEPVARSTAAGVLADTERRWPGDDWSPDWLLRVAGLPFGEALRKELIGDLRRLRDWLTVRLESVPDRADCTLSADVRAVSIPVPRTGDDRVELDDLRVFAAAAGALLDCLRRLLTDCACRSLLPACPDCADSDVLLARLTLLDCDVVRICTVDRPQAQPRMPDARVRQARELAARICCPPAGEKRKSVTPPVLAYVAGLLEPATFDTDLDDLLALLLETPDGSTR